MMNCLGDPPQPPLKKGGEYSQVLRDIKGAATSGFPLLKGDGRGILQGDLGGSLKQNFRPKTCVYRSLTKGGLRGVNRDASRPSCPKFESIPCRSQPELQSL
jgi:hypothetical protein